MAGNFYRIKDRQQTFFMRETERVAWVQSDHFILIFLFLGLNNGPPVPLMCNLL